MSEELINRRRRQLHVHSILYYGMHTNIVDDATFDKWAVELVELHEEFPELVHKGYMHTLFANWTGDTGMHLPITDEAWATAQDLLRMKEKRGE